jgi:hypothetical protein
VMRSAGHFSGMALNPLNHPGGTISLCRYVIAKNFAETVFLPRRGHDG